MTDQRPSGYRGALPTRNDTIARPWVLAVVGIFVLMFVLAFLGFPSSLFPAPSGSPNPSFSLSPSTSAAPSASGASASEAASASEQASASEAASASVEASASEAVALADGIARGGLMSRSTGPIDTCSRLSRVDLTPWLSESRTELRDPKAKGCRIPSVAARTGRSPQDQQVESRGWRAPGMA